MIKFTKGDFPAEKSYKFYFLRWKISSWFNPRWI